MARRMGIYAGTFDPVHAGHIAFALQAMQRAKLDGVHFLPERRPRNKQAVEHFGHRVAMLRRATTPHPKFAVLELDDVSFSVERTLPKLRRKFASDQLVFLFGSDAARYLGDWPLVERLLCSTELVIGVRGQDDQAQLQKVIAHWPTKPQAITTFASYAPAVSSTKVRAALRYRKPTAGLLKSVERYNDRHWLYISLA